VERPTHSPGLFPEHGLVIAGAWRDYAVVCAKGKRFIHALVITFFIF
jgi:hypothetical protein